LESHRAKSSSLFLSFVLGGKKSRKYGMEITLPSSFSHVPQRKSRIVKLGAAGAPHLVRLGNRCTLGTDRIVGIRSHTVRVQDYWAMLRVGRVPSVPTVPSHTSVPVWSATRQNSAGRKAGAKSFFFGARRGSFSCMRWVFECVMHVLTILDGGICSTRSTQ
jgi:hypothetical protein